MHIEIRDVRDGDQTDIQAIFAADSVMANTSQIPYRSAKFWREFYPSDDANGVELAAVCDGKVVGHLGVFGNTRSRRRHAAAFGMAVHPDYQGQGVGKALMSELIRLADNWLDLIKIELTVFVDNEAAIALYRRFGFVIEGYARFDCFKHGEYADSYKMARYNPNRVDPEHAVDWPGLR